MTTVAEPRSKPSRGGVARWIQLLCLVFAAFVIAENVGFCLWDAGLAPRAGSLGAGFDRAGAGGDGFVQVVSIEPRGALSGLAVVGDRVAFDRPYDYERYLRAGEVVSFRVAHAGKSTRHRIVVPPRKPVAMSGTVAARLAFDVAFSISALLGAFVVWRGGLRTTPLLLGAALICVGLDWTLPPFWLSSPTVYFFDQALGYLIIVWGAPVLFYAFALRFYEDCAGPGKTWEKAAFWLYALVQAVLTALRAVAKGQVVDWPLIGDGDVATFYVGANVGLAACVVYLFLGWRHSSANLQQRYALMLCGSLLLVLAQVIGNFISLDTPDPRLMWSAAVLGAIAPVLFAYAILRHRVFDLGFALNRTLVYGVVSAILLAAFGVIEWAVDHFVPIEGREKNALIDAAIAVGVFLTFHRVRDWVEHVIEGLFFRHWQQAEAALRRFVREAPFFTEAPALTRAFVEALSAYAEGAPAAVYLAEGSGYARAAGDVAGASARLAPDLRAMVSLRADLKPLEDDALNAALIAPMVNRNEVIGLALLGRKPSGLDLRPDEIDLIGWATRQVGLDLNALEMEQLQADRTRLQTSVSALEHALAVRPGP